MHLTVASRTTQEKTLHFSGEDVKAALLQYARQYGQPVPEGPSKLERLTMLTQFQHPEDAAVITWGS